MFSLALNFDHKVIDGAPAARFLKEVCNLLEGGLKSYLPENEQPDELLKLEPNAVAS
jgi:hypothetical protein